ncbi:hypothetical protein A6769_14370 [Nostoc punctiforme NIES-2108]|uniref:Uncharacterized protein n=1 Tax=Nostoc punctiforme NIES-2108 TaxID=1356359 RepID=A0A367RL03_NOSPU|nr:hypothetical protein A6769_14370 [Nostoc punctiforme NIES-2108]
MLPNSKLSTGLKNKTQNSAFLSFLCPTQPTKNKIPTSLEGYLYLFNELVPNFSSPLLLIENFKCHQINSDKKNLFVTT